LFNYGSCNSDMEFSHYEVVPAHIAQKLIAIRQEELAAAKEE